MGCQETSTQGIVDGGGVFITQAHDIRQTNYIYSITDYISRRVFSGLGIYPGKDSYTGKGVQDNHDTGV